MIPDPTRRRRLAGELRAIAAETHVLANCLESGTAPPDLPDEAAALAKRLEVISRGLAAPAERAEPEAP